MQYLKLFSFLMLFAFISVTAQDEKKDTTDVHQFKFLHQIKTTPVKNQSRTGTCWSFATTSFIETELIRMGKGEFILTPMFFVRYAYPQKAERFVRYQGNLNFAMGGQAHDVMNVIKKYGFIPESIYDGLKYGEEKHNHGEMDGVLKAVAEQIIKKKGGKLTPVWPKIIEAALDIYLGEVPAEFEYQNKKYTPKSFAKELGFNADDYIEFTSYTHHPFYTTMVLEIPDNWSGDAYYNIPIDEIMEIMDYALENGYSVAWDGDVSEKYFYGKEGYAVVPEDKDEEEKDEEEKNTPEKEKTITQEMRQETFNNYLTTDDHLMHLTGIAENQEGTKFYYTKNSWGTEERKYDGYWYMSDSFVKLKTVAIMVHKDAVPKAIKNKLSIK